VGVAHVAVARAHAQIPPVHDIEAIVHTPMKRRRVVQVAARAATRRVLTVMEVSWLRGTGRCVVDGMTVFLKTIQILGPDLKRPESAALG